MDIVSAVSFVDGNQYQVQNDSTDSESTGEFDSVYNAIETNDLTLDEIFQKVSDEYGVDVNLLKAVAQAESGFDASAVSYCGAMGMMQLMPATAESLGVEDPFDAEQSITGGAKMLGYLLDDYNGNVTLALAAYNAGSGSVQKYGGVPPYDQTLHYIEKINDLLGGALENDSRTIEGASATDLSRVTAQEAPDVEVHSNKMPTDAIEGQGEIKIGISYPTVEDMLKAKAYESSENTSPLFRYEDYEVLLNTYKEIYEKRLTDAKEETNITQTADNPNMIDSVVQGQDTQNQQSQNMVIQNTNQDENVTTAQSLYEMQAAMVSPLAVSLRKSE